MWDNHIIAGAVASNFGFKHFVAVKDIIDQVLCRFSFQIFAQGFVDVVDSYRPAPLTHCAGAINAVCCISAKQRAVLNSCHLPVV